MFRVETLSQIPVRNGLRDFYGIFETNYLVGRITTVRFNIDDDSFPRWLLLNDLAIKKPQQGIGYGNLAVHWLNGVMINEDRYGILYNHISDKGNRNFYVERGWSRIGWDDPEAINFEFFLRNRQTPNETIKKVRQKLTNDVIDWEDRKNLPESYFNFDKRFFAKRVNF